jgi:DNA-binding Lrp family transcriptional regulator
LEFVARRRLKQLFDAGYIKRVRADILAQYVYYYEKKPQRFPHWLKIADFYLALKGLGVKIEMFEVEKKVGDCIPDAVYHITRMIGDTPYHLVGFLEVHRSNNPFNTQKYDKLFDNEAAWKDELGFKKFPNVVIIEEKPAIVKLAKKPIRYIKINGKLSNIREILKIT